MGGGSALAAVFLQKIDQKLDFEASHVDFAAKACVANVFWVAFDQICCPLPVLDGPFEARREAVVWRFIHTVST